MSNPKEYAYSHNGEEFMDFDSAIDYALTYVSNIHEAKEAKIYVGEIIRPKIDIPFLVTRVSEFIEESLYEQCGEWAESYEVPKDRLIELRDYLKFWEAKLSYGCFTVKDIKETSLCDYISDGELKEFYINS